MRDVYTMPYLVLRCSKCHRTWTVPDNPDVRGPTCPLPVAGRFEEGAVCGGLPTSGKARRVFLPAEGHLTPKRAP